MSSLFEKFHKEFEETEKFNKRFMKRIFCMIPIVILLGVAGIVFVCWVMIKLLAHFGVI